MTIWNVLDLIVGGIVIGGFLFFVFSMFFVIFAKDDTGRRYYELDDLSDKEDR